MKTRKRIVSILLAAIMVISGIPSMVLAADETSGLNIPGSKKASPTTLGQDRKTTVTLSLPSGEYQNKVDIVFVMDDSTSTKNNNLDFSGEALQLFKNVVDKNPGIELKVGVIKFKGRAFDTIDYASSSHSGLTVYNESTKNEITDAINYDFGKDYATYGRGSNLHGGLELAYEWLKNDNDVDNSNKYLITLTDGKSYIWNDSDGNPVTFYTQSYYNKAITAGGSGRYTIENNGSPSMGQKPGTYYKASYPLIVGDTPLFIFNGDDKSAYEELYSNTHKHLVGNEFDSRCMYAADGTGNPLPGSIPSPIMGVKDQDGNAIPILESHGDYNNYYEFVPAPGWQDIKWFEANPYKIVKNEDGTAYYDTTQENPNYYETNPDSLQKGLYKAGHLWNEMKSKGYRTGSIIFTGYNDKYLSIGRSFCNWLKDKSDYGANINNASDVQGLFDNIDNSIRYMVGSGVVTDEIKDDFDLDESSATPFSMTYDGSPLSVASAGENKWNFDSANEDGVFPYVVEYDKSTKTITWTINVPIENLKKITLSYDLILKEDRAPGTYDTNKSAILVYNSSDGKYQGRKYEFEVPKVEYSKPAPTPASYTLTINYVYSTGGTAAPTYTASLKAGTSYGPINSPTIKGYKADRTSISGVMPEGNATYTVVYTPTGGDKPNNPGGGGGNPPNNPADGGAAVTPAEPATAEVVPDEPAPAAEPAEIPDEPAPLAGGAWALVNLISAILTSLGAIIALFRRKEEEDEDEDEDQNAYKAEDEEEEDDNRGKKMLAAKIAGVLAGVAAPIVFFLTEDMSLPMIMIDKWTILMIAILAVQIVAAVFNKKASELDDDEEETAEEAAN